MNQLEPVSRIEPARLENPSEAIADIVAELSAATAILDRALHPRTAANLSALVRIMNAYYSNLIEGHNTLPKDIERALAGNLDEAEDRRNLQLEAAAHVRVQAQIDSLAAQGELPSPTSAEFIQWLHREFYHNAPEEMLRIRGAGREFAMEPGAWRSRPEHDVTVGRHAPPASDRVMDFMGYFAERYELEHLGMSGRIIVMAAAHHRLNYIHPFPDGNGRVSRLMSHAIAHAAGIGAHGLWSISCGLARGLEDRSDYKRMMDHADMPRQGDLDGRGNLSQRALGDFVLWFLKVALDQAKFMSSLFELDTLSRRLRILVNRHDDLRPEAAHILDEVLLRGEMERGEVSRITGLSERTARRLLNDVTAKGFIASDTPKGPVSLRFPIAAAEILFPRLFPEADQMLS
jgi:Fic family protein